MVDYDYLSFEKFERAARSFARSLLTEGYFVVTSYLDRKHCLSFIKMHHGTNKNKISIIANDECWQATKNGKLIKKES